MSHPKLAVVQSGYGGRGYKIPGRVEDNGFDAKGKAKIKNVIYPSVTTVLKQVAKEGLHQWIADQTAAFAVANISYLMQQREEIAWGRLRFYWSKAKNAVASELRYYHEGVRDDAAELGTNIHEWMETMLDGISDQPELDSVQAEEMAVVLIEFMSRHKIVPNVTEFTLVNDELRYAGTADADWTITCLHGPDKDGLYCLGDTPGPHRALIDLKTSRNTWPEHGMQLASLRACPIRMVEVGQDYPGAQLHEKTEKGEKKRTWWVERPTEEYDRVGLLHIRPSDLDNNGEKIEPFVKMIDLTNKIEIYMKGFVGARALAEMNYELAHTA